MRARGAACLVIALAVVAATVMRPSEARAYDIGSLNVTAITGRTATLVVGSLVLDEGEDTASGTMYLKYRVLGTTTWVLVGSCAVTHGSGCSRSISGLALGTTYQARAALGSYNGGLGANKNFTTLDTGVTGLSISSITTSSASLQVNLANPDGDSLTVHYRYRPSGGAYTSGTGTTSGTSASFAISGLTSGTSYYVQASLYSGYYPSRSGSFATQSGASLSSVSASGVTGVSATVAVSMTNPDTLPVAVYLRYRKNPQSAWTTRSASTTGASAAFQLSGLEHGWDYSVQASLSGSYTNTTSGTFTTGLIAPECGESNNPPVDLGEIGIAAGSVLTHQGSVPGTVAAAPCVDSDSRSGAYFRFSVASGEAGAVKVEASPGTSPMSPDLLVRSGDAYTGTALFKDTRAGEDNALAAGLVDAGTHTLQLRSGARLTGSGPASGGAYSVTVTRLQPRVASVSALPTSLSTIWDVGAATSTGADNGVDLSVMIDYREDSAQAWTSAETSISPSDQQQSVSTTITGLDIGRTYHVRAAYTNAAVYVESGGILTRARILLSGAPYGVEATAGLVDEAIRRYEVRAAWETPPIVADDNIEWGYATRVDGGVPHPNEAGREHVQETVFFYSGDAVRGGALTIEVINSFECLAPDASETDPWTTCALTYNERDYTLPVDAYWSTPWSAPALARIAGPGFTAGTTGMDKPPDDAVVQLIDLGFELAGVGPEDRPSHALSVMLCAAIALTAGIGIALKTGGMKLPQVALGSGLFYSIFGGIGPFLFGVPGALVVVTVAAPVGLGGAWLMRRFTL